MILQSAIGSIPSPSFNTIDIGPLSLTMYGLMIGLGIIAATMVARPRAVARGMHPDTPVEMLLWVVPAGIVGARLYHIVTDGVPIADWVKVWEGGLGIPGAILGGAIAALAFVRQRGLDRAKVLDAVVPGVALAQAVGRWGNWWNQELYGRPTDLPWALEIDADHRLSGYAEFDTFHPTFLYESLWNAGLCLFLIWLDSKKVLKPGKLIWVYAAVYAVGRIWIEALRIDPATEIGGVRVNLWTMGVVIAISAFMLRDGRRDRTGGADVLADHERPEKAASSGDDTSTDDDYDEDTAETSEGLSAQLVPSGDDEEQ